MIALMGLLNNVGAKTARLSQRSNWRMHKALETLAPQNPKKNPPLIISNQIAYKLKCAIEHFFPPKKFLV